jgi:uncharacterized DUF497 family protein
MNPVTAIHNEVMGFADHAFLARLNGDSEKALQFFRKAFELECKAAEHLMDRLDAEPFRSVLLRSAATLALDCGEYKEVERLANLGLTGKPPAEIADELREVLERSLVMRLEAEGKVIRLEHEERLIIVGHSANWRLLFVSFTDQKGVIRIISARKATRTEQKEYEQNF